MTQQTSSSAVADLLLFDAFDVLLELGVERGFSDLVCFLAEADRIRLPDDARTTTAARQQRILDQYWHKVEGVAREAGVPDTEALASFVRRRIPFPTVFAPVCDAVYERIKQLVGELSAPAVMRRIIPNIDDLKPELSSVLRSAVYRKHYQAFLANNRAGPELGTLNCCDEVRLLLDSIHEYILPVEAGPSTNQQQQQQHQQQPGSALSIPSADKKQHSLAASRGAREALVMGSGGTAEAASASSLLGDALSDPMLVFGRLLVALRQLQRKFFNYTNGSTASVAGISEALRMELATTLNMTSSVRANDVESVDSAFAAACAGRMVRLLRSLERESFQHLQLQFPEFIQSNEYFVSLAAVRAESCESIVQWQNLQTLLTTRVAEEKIVYWTDPEAFGKTFALCEETSAAADSASNANAAAPRGLLLKGQMSSSPGSVVKMWSVEGISCKLSNPFLVSQETLRRVLSGLYGEAQGRLNQERGGEGESDGNFCVSFFLHPDSTAAKALLLLLYPSFNRVFGSGEFLCIAVSSINAQHVGVACSLCAPPASPLLDGLRRASLWTLGAEQPDCLKFDIPINQNIETTTWRLIDIYGIDGPPHDSLLGPCDCSISEAVRALDLRVTLQVLLLLLTNRSVLLVGTSSSRLSHLQAVLPRLAFPFLLHQTHSLAEQFSTAEEVEQWVQRLLEPGGGQRWLASCLTRVYNAASHDAKLKMAAQEGAGSEAGASHKGVFVVDVDSCRVMKSADPALKGSVGSRNSGSGSAQFSKLSDAVMFTKLNSKSFRALHAAFSSSSPTNSTCQHAFLRYFVGIFLRFLPPTILHYPRHSVVACNVKRFLSDQPRLPNTGVHGGNGPGADSETIEIEFVTELVGLSSPSFVHLLKNHSSLFEHVGAV